MYKELLTQDYSCRSMCNDGCVASIWSSIMLSALRSCYTRTFFVQGLEA